jgi:ATP-dependent DNA ligase
MSSLYPESRQIKPMLYNGHPRPAIVDSAFNSNEYIMQEKRDGYLYQLEYTKSGYVYFFSRTTSKKTGELTEKSANFPHLVEWAKNNLPKDTILIGEIYIPGGTSKDVTKIAGCLPARAIHRQFEEKEYQPVHYYIFDCIYWDGKNLIDSGFETRYNNIEIKDSEYVELASNIKTDFELELNKIFQNGGEGAVFKKKDAKYKVGGRATFENFKFKQHLDSVDLICIGIEEPEKYYNGIEAITWPYKDEKGRLVTKPYFYGWKNALTLGCYNQEGKIVKVGRVASGLTDSMREDLANNPDKYLGKVVQVSCMSLNKVDLTLRHPVFETMRDDKDPQDCKLIEIF